MIDVIVSGNLRGELSAFCTLRGLLDARAKGLVDQIVLSTWEDELARFPHMTEVISGEGITLALQQHPHPYGGSLVIQHMQFQRGVEALGPSRNWVLKTRTDKALGLNGELMAALRDGVLEATMSSTPRSVLSHKLIVGAVSLSEPLAHNDLIILGARDDFSRCINADAMFDYVINDQGYLPQEARWFLVPVMQALPSLRSLLQQVSSPRISAAVRVQAQRGLLASAPQALFQYLAMSIAVSRELFGLIDHRDHGPTAPLEQYFSCQMSRPVAVHWGDRVLATSQLWLNGLEKAADDAVAERLRACLPAFDDLKDFIPAIDVEALAAFADGPASNASPAPRYRRIAARPPLDGVGRRPLAHAFLRPPFDNPPRDLMDRLEAAVAANADDPTFKRLVGFAGELEIEARASGDRHAFYIAYLAYMVASWARVPEGLDGACGIAIEGHLTDDLAEDAFRAVYPIYAMNPNAPTAKFWHGVEHLRRSDGGPGEQVGLDLIRQAAGAGLARAQAYLLERSTSDAGSSP